MTHFRIAAAAFSTAVALFASASTASASFHLMQIREVSAGSETDPDVEFLELQMYADGQNFVNTHQVYFTDSDGMPATTVTFTADVPNGQNQRSILVASSDFTAATGITPNLEWPTGAFPDVISSAGGAACFVGVDCVAWGGFTAFGNVGGAANVGTPEPGAIEAGQSITRSISRGCATLLDAPDDTNDSATDFEDTVAPTPRNNAGAVTETPCLPTGTPSTPLPTGQRAAALKKCKRKKTAKARKKCRKKAKLLPL